MRASETLNFLLSIDLLSLCSPKEKVTKRKCASQGRLLSHGFEVEITRNRSCPLRKHHVFCAGGSRHP